MGDEPCRGGQDRFPENLRLELRSEGREGNQTQGKEMFLGQTPKSMRPRGGMRVARTSDHGEGAEDKVALPLVSPLGHALCRAVICMVFLPPWLWPPVVKSRSPIIKRSQFYLLQN